MDFRSARTAPRISRIFRRDLALGPVAIPGIGVGARAIWVAGDTPNLLEGATDPSGVWRTVAAIRTPLSSPQLSVAASRSATRLVTVVQAAGPRESVGFAQAGPARVLPPLRDLYTPAEGRRVTQLLPIFRGKSADAAVLVETLADPLQTAIEAVSVSGASVEAPRTVVSGQRIAFPESLQVASLPDGRLVAVWRRVSPPHVQVMFSLERTAGGAWAPPIPVSGVDRRAGEPSLVVAPGGQPVVAWSDGMRVLARVLRTRRGRASEPAFALSRPGRGCRQPVIAASGRRTLTAAFVCEAGRNLYVTSRTLPAS